MASGATLADVAPTEYSCPNETCGHRPMTTGDMVGFHDGVRYDVVKSCLICSKPPTREAWGLAADGSLVLLDEVVPRED